MRNSCCLLAPLAQRRLCLLGFLPSVLQAASDSVHGRARRRASDRPQRGFCRSDRRMQLAGGFCGPVGRAPRRGDTPSRAPHAAAASQNRSYHPLPGGSQVHSPVVSWTWRTPPPSTSGLAHHPPPIARACCGGGWGQYRWEGAGIKTAAFLFRSSFGKTQPYPAKSRLVDISVRIAPDLVKFDGGALAPPSPCLPGTGPSKSRRELATTAPGLDIGGIL